MTNEDETTIVSVLVPNKKVNFQDDGTIVYDKEVIEKLFKNYITNHTSDELDFEYNGKSFEPLEMWLTEEDEEIEYADGTVVVEPSGTWRARVKI
jgi:hypothetical protein